MVQLVMIMVLTWRMLIICLSPMSFCYGSVVSVVAISFACYFFNQNIHDWMLSNLNLVTCANGRNWSIIFLVALDNLWRCMNDFISENMRKVPYMVIKHSS